MLRVYRKKWAILAILSFGTVFQIANCGTELSLLGLRTAFSSFTLPIDILIRNLILAVL
ncbi:MAG TPA: hypothetical protein VMV81_06155 [Phycisphaerae bacterium]|nr:hypothetical protein [Phycisphaerae bacterium]